MRAIRSHPCPSLGPNWMPHTPPSPLSLPLPSVLPLLDSASRSRFLPEAPGACGGPQVLSPDSSLLLPSSSLVKGTMMETWP